MKVDNIIRPELHKLRETFVSHGFDLRLVGGCVRDMIHGVKPKDIDLCTDADPVDQVMIYKAAKVPFYETGLAHGTLSVRLGSETFEITSLRTESNHDGRHATVSYTRDWLADLGRRDLTFNAMSMTFDGVLIDPFNGVDDLKNGVVRFVGDPDARMQEDYLRILRWLRFHGRFAPNKPLDAETVEAAQRQAPGLQGISRERVWMEVSKIIAGDGAVGLVNSIYDLGIAGAIGLPMGDIDRFRFAWNYTKNPVTLMVALLNTGWSTAQPFPDIAGAWKWSAEERDLAHFLASSESSWGIEQLKWLLAHDNKPKAWVMERARLNGDLQTVSILENWQIPVFPVKGQDLLEKGMKPSPDIGKTLSRLKNVWATCNYEMTKQSLLNMCND